MKKLNALLLIWVTNIASSALAQPLADWEVAAPCAAEVVKNRRAVLAHDGDSGIWFHGAVARCMLGRLAALPEYAARLHLLEERLKLSDDRDLLRLEQTQLAAQEADAALNALQNAVRRARIAEEKNKVWYRHPAFLISTGAIGIVIIEVVAIILYAKR